VNSVWQMRGASVHRAGSEGTGSPGGLLWHNARR
jgi:hypothetical protein